METQIKTERLSLRVTAEEKRQFEQILKSRNLTMSKFFYAAAKELISSK
ncbi:MAG: hypothetical protein KME10_19295 [Plectolyngbya sp. WJT66-NPBG17]|jgi:antitoxin component of RelBE/YafQ-DinJ toxin-antitoxin module|nr:hypothetical protein [Plectolyngbya sp. WJT66-NPBG17]